MILPYPIVVSVNSEVQLIDLSDCPKILDDLNELFVEPRRANKGPMKAKAKYEESEDDEGPLPVETVGGYKISVARSIRDLRRVDKSVFILNPDVGELLKTHYPDGFGFLICAFDPKLGVAGHPIGYVHDLPLSGEYFIPTRHEHGTEELSGRHGRDDDSEGDEDPEPHVPSGTAHFDHAIFTINAATNHGAGVLCPKDNKVIMKVLGVKQIKRLLPHTVQLRRLVLRGDFENEDRYIASNPIPLTGTDVFVITKGPQAVAVESNKAKADEWVVNSTYTQSRHVSTEELAPTMFVVTKMDGEVLFFSADIKETLHAVKQRVFAANTLDNRDLKLALLSGYNPDATAQPPVTYFLSTVTRDD